MAMLRACLVFVAILVVVAPIRAEDPPLSKTGGSGPGFPSFNPNPGKCSFKNGRWFCPGGGGNPPVPPGGCRCCEGNPVNTPNCREQCALVACEILDCGCCGPNPSRTPRCQTQCAATSCLAIPPASPPAPGPDPASCRCCSLDKAARPEGCGAVCRAVPCAQPILPPNLTSEDCGCCEGVRRNIPGCDRVCDLDPCPGAPTPPVDCNCCAKNQKTSAECQKLCGLRLCPAPPVATPPPSDCNCCGPQKFVEGTNKVSLKVAGLGCDCRNVLCPQVHINTLG